jgi:hypothetical protein
MRRHRMYDRLVFGLRAGIGDIFRLKVNIEYGGVIVPPPRRGRREGEGGVVVLTPSARTTAAAFPGPGSR